MRVLIIRFETIKNCGKLGFNFSMSGGNGTKISKDFLEKLICNIVKRSTNYFNDTGEHIFTFREKQLHSVICPSISDLTPSVVIEHPLTRKPTGEDEYSGHVDYWASYRNYEFLVELKHSHFAYNNANNPRKDISNKFNTALNQLQNIRKEECRYITINNKGCFKIALQAIVFYEGSKHSISADDLKDKYFEDYFEKLLKIPDLKKKSNFNALWLLNEKLIKPVDYDDGSYEIFPAVAFVGKVHDLII